MTYDNKPKNQYYAIRWGVMRTSYLEPELSSAKLCLNRPYQVHGVPPVKTATCTCCESGIIEVNYPLYEDVA